MARKWCHLGTQALRPCRRRCSDAGPGPIFAAGDTKVSANTIAREGRTVEMDKNSKDQNEKPSTTLPGVVQKIIKSRRPSVPEKAEIEVKGVTIFTARSALT